MTALHIIGENFKLWFCIDGSPFGQQQILVALVCIGLLRVGTHKDFTIENGERIAQMVIAKHERAKWQEVSQLGTTERGTGGFGSTGVK